MKKKIVAIMLAGMMSLSAVACGGTSDTQEPDTQEADSNAEDGHPLTKQVPTTQLQMRRKRKTMVLSILMVKVIM